MARVFIDGFDHGSTGLWDVDTGVEISAGSKITGIYSIYQSSPISKSIQKTIDAAGEIFIAFRSFFAAASVNDRISIIFNDGSGNMQGGVRIIAFTTYIAVSTINSVETTIDSYNFYGFEEPISFQIRFLNTDTDDKTIQVKINNVLRLDSSFTNTSPDSTTTSEIEIELSYMMSSYIDDIIIDDAEWPGSPYVYTISPDADGATNEWSPSTGVDNYAVVNEIPPNITDYVETNVSGEVDLYNFANLPDDEDWTPRSVQVSAYALSPGSPAYEYAALGVRVGGTDYFGSSHHLGTGYSHITEIWDSNPASGEWTEFLVNNIEAGIKCEAS